MITQPLITHFPLPRPHCGPTLGNGLQGLLAWGETTLRLTVARAGFWDHRGGRVMLPTTTFATARDRLEADDDPGLRALYPDAPPVDGIAALPQQFGGGRLELTFADGLRPLRAELDLTHGVPVVQIGRDVHAATTQALIIRQDPTPKPSGHWASVKSLAAGDPVARSQLTTPTPCPAPPPKTKSET